MKKAYLNHFKLSFSTMELKAHFASNCLTPKKNKKVM